jgi:ADP-ribose pyrophosphatase
MPAVWLPVDDAVAAVFRGELHNPLAVMGVLAVAHARANGWVGLRSADSPWPERPVSGVKG